MHVTAIDRIKVDPVAALCELAEHVRHANLSDLQRSACIGHIEELIRTLRGASVISVVGTAHIQLPKIAKET